MSEPHELDAYDYVNHPYHHVRDALKADPNGIFQRATQGAASRAGELAASLKVELGGIEVGAAVEIEVRSIDEDTSEHSPVTRLALAWKAQQSPALFPSMNATLSVYPLSKGETQLDLHGVYTPPAGALGSAVDTLVLGRVAKASVHRFVSDVARLLRSELADG
jgi:hypothetical protein